ncbi:hypothetical protein EDB92DRAFT_2039250 [Lactarius akahatsu]|uniref:Uncharacterized protein n=1 Tax=Lactarius akahatsu TaxID=416441 RepID=A0AAD4LL33_9AGAM|nr:hypothetical protein EDB92DRAFT_2039250 [Lactarius akahatsu]
MICPHFGTRHKFWQTFSYFTSTHTSLTLHLHPSVVKAHTATCPRLGHSLRAAIPPPPAYQAPVTVWDRVKKLKCDEKIWWGPGPREAVQGADVVVTDTWYWWFAGPAHRVARSTATKATESGSSSRRRGTVGACGNMPYRQVGDVVAVSSPGTGGVEGKRTRSQLL